MGWYSRWRARRQAKKGGYASYDTNTGTATYVPAKGEAVQTTVPPKVASVYTKDYVGGGGSTTITEGIGYTSGGGTTSKTITRTSPTGITTTEQVPIITPTTNLTNAQKSALSNLQKFEASRDFSSSQLNLSDYQSALYGQGNQNRGIYSRRAGGFIKSPYGIGAGGTGIVTQPTIDEQIKIKEAQKRGGDVGTFKEGFIEFPEFYLGGYYGGSYTPEEYEKTGNILDVINPIEQAKVFISQKEYENAIPEFVKTNEKLEKAYNSFENKWGSLIQDNNFIGTEEQFNKYSKDYNSLNTQFNYYQNQPAYQKVLNEYKYRETIGQKISNSGFSNKKRFLLSGLVGLGQFGAFVSPVYRFVAGTELGISGVGTLSKAKTTKEFLKGGVELGIGTILVKSGAGGGLSLLGKGTKSKGVLSWLANQEKKLGLSLMGKEGGIAQKSLGLMGSRGGKAIKTFALPTYFSAESGIHEYKSTGDLSVALGKGLGSFAGLTIPMGYESIRRGTKLSAIELKKLEVGLNKLQDSKIVDATIIRKGKGTLKNSDLVEIKAIQKVEGFSREIIIKGDLIKTSGGWKIFPKGQGKATTSGLIKLKNKATKQYLDVQTFEIGQIGKGIYLGNLKGYEIGTSKSISIYSPKFQVSKLFKIPRGRFPVKQIREKKESIKDYLAKTELKRGGTHVIELEGGKTLSVERKEVSSKEKPHSTEVKKYEITDFSIELGKLDLLEPIGSVGATFSKKRFGTFIKTTEPITKSMIIKKADIKKTPLSETFKETPIKDFVSPTRVKREVKQVQTKKIPDFEKELMNKLVDTTKKGLKERTKKSIERLEMKKLQTDIPLQGFSISSQSKEEQKERQKTRQEVIQLQKPRQKTRQEVIQLQKPALRTLQKEALGLKQILNEKLIEELIPMSVIRPRLNVPLRPTPIPIPRIPFFPRRKKKGFAKKQPKESYDVYIKQPKKKTFTKITKKPVGLIEGRDARNFFIDSSLSRQGYLKQRHQNYNLIFQKIMLKKQNKSSGSSNRKKELELSYQKKD